MCKIIGLFNKDNNSKIINVRTYAMFDCTKRQSSHHENIANICPALMN